MFHFTKIARQVSSILFWITFLKQAQSQYTWSQWHLWPLPLMKNSRKEQERIHQLNSQHPSRRHRQQTWCYRWQQYSWDIWSCPALTEFWADCIVFWKDNSSIIFTRWKYSHHLYRRNSLETIWLLNVKCLRRISFRDVWASNWHRKPNRVDMRLGSKTLFTM